MPAQWQTFRRHLTPPAQALALIGTPSNLNDQVRLAHQRWRLIRETSARWALRNNGLNLGAPQPVEGTVGGDAYLKRLVEHFRKALLQQ